MNQKTNILPIVSAFLCLLFCSTRTQGQTFGPVASAVWLTDCNQSNFFNTSGSGANLIGPAGNIFTDANLGVYTQNSGTLILRGAEVRTSKEAIANVCSVRMYYRIYLQSGIGGAFNSINLPLLDNCDIPSGQFPSGGSCTAGDQKWNRVTPNGATVPYAPVNLTSFAPGNYVLEVYYDVVGSSTTTTQCDETIVLNNSGNNYKAYFSIQAPVLASNNPTTCNGTEGYITISGLIPGSTYILNYTDDGVPVGPANLIANGSGQGIISGLNEGVYSNIEILINGCTTEFFTGIILSNPVFTPTFTKIASFCAGSIQPILPPASNNGISGTWNPSVVNNQSSGSYTFTPTAGQCGLPAVMNVTVIQRTTPTFSFGTTLAICAGGTVPALPATSTNGLTGTWSPGVVDNQASGVYTFTPAAGLCATPATFTVTVTPNISPTFNFGVSLTVCAGGAVPALPGTSSNGISGSWSPATVDNQNSGTYTFTPGAGMCATPATFAVTVNPNITPTFSFGTSLIICGDGTVPLLPTASLEGITGTWNPSSVDDQNSGSYTFTPDAGLCATTTTFTVTVNPNITPTFSFGTSLTICENGAVPSLPTTSSNGINGVWNPSSVDNQNSGVYTFTPDAGLCATAATFTVTVNPNITPTFSFGTSLTICAGGAIPALPASSSNGINGTWNPAVVSDQASDVYTFTPAAGVCATTTTFTVTVNPNITPTFSFGTSLTICGSGAVPALPAVSIEGITGVWNPAVVSDQASDVYTFTPAAGLCATPTTFTVTVNPNIIPTFSFGTSLTICEGGIVPSLPVTSTNGITGTWNPAAADNQNSGSYTFTPTAGLCATTTTFTVTVNPNITPTFSFGTASTICTGGTVPVLTATSIEGITGTWSPSSVDDQNSGTYTFTPTAGLCATPTTFAVIVNPNVTPTFSFGTALTICAGGPIPVLDVTSTEGIAGTWNPAVVSDQASGIYTFTPAAGLCATATTFTVTVNPNITPTFVFGTSLVICTDGIIPTLPTTSANNIDGSWSPAVVSNQISDTYTFTPNPGLCATATTFTVTVNPNITPTFSFGTSLIICADGTVPALPLVSTNGINGVWNPAVASSQVSDSYTFTPTAGQCATITTFTITVDPNIIPAFSFGSSLTICAGGIVPALSTTSTNGIDGTWNPASVNDQASGTYTFTPVAGTCATSTTFTVTVNPNITPTFAFGASLSACTGAAVPVLPATSVNGITGVWSPSSIDNLSSGVYTFTPAPGECAVTTQLTVTINPILTPVFDFGTALTICSGNVVPALPAVSTNGINGTWDPADVSNAASGIYTFTPAAGECGTTTTFTVTVTPTVIPVFSFGPSLVMCAGGTAPILPATSTNGIDGVWTPAVVNNQASGTYTFTPTATPEQCITPASFTVTVKQIETPTFSFGTSLSICAGSTAPSLPTSSTNSISGTWSPATINNQVSGTYKFTSAPNQCATASITLTVTVNPVGTVNASSDTVVNDGAMIPANNFSGTPSGVVYSWSNSNPAIGLPASGTGDVPVFTATNRGNDPITGTITVTPTINGCAGAARSYVVTVKPLNKDVFVPNVFSPNGDGKNDILFVYGNYIDKLDMRIFNQWGEQVIAINQPEYGWDGTHRGKAQPVGVYVYTLQATMSDGRTVKLKGSITLLR